MRPGFLERLKERPVLFDGAMGTMLYARGVFINTCFVELNLSRPDFIRDIHTEYVNAGAEALETNTFGADPIHLAAYGLAGKCGDINRAAVRLAREAAGDDVFVVGSIRSALVPGQINKTNMGPAGDSYRAQIDALTEEGVDALLFETFGCVEDALFAAEIGKSYGVPVMVLLSVDDRGETALGITVERAMAMLENSPSVDVLGLNCGTGPAKIYDAAERAIPHCRKPFVVIPNAGLPREVDGRMLYLTSPEYFTEYGKKLIELGVRGFGGCCGTTPAHISEAARAIRGMSGVKRHIEVVDMRSKAVEVEVVPLEKKSRLSAKITAGDRATSIELTPPRSTDLSPFLERARMCAERGVDAINIPDGPRASARICPMAAAWALQKEGLIEPLLHYCCRDRNLIGMQSDLLGAAALGLRNVLIITGDPPKLGNYPEATGVFDVDAIGLVGMARNLNHGVDIGGSPINPPTALFLGVGANPCAVSPQLEMDRFVAKVGAGAEFAITQPVFDPDALLRFMDQVESAGCGIPLLAGIWPLTSMKNAEFMRNEVPGVTVPDSVMARMSAARTKEQALAEGVNIARDIMKAVESRVSGFQVSAPFGKVEIAFDVLGF